MRPNTRASSPRPGQPAPQRARHRRRGRRGARAWRAADHRQHRAQPLSVQPARPGADIVVHSATKYLAATAPRWAAWSSSPASSLGQRQVPRHDRALAGYHGVKFYETFGDFGFTMRCRMETLRTLRPALSPDERLADDAGHRDPAAAHAAPLRECAGRGAAPAKASRRGLGQLPRACRHPQHALAQRRSRQGHPGAGPAGVRHQGRRRRPASASSTPCSSEPPGQHRRGTYSQAVQVGNTVYMSGQIGLDPATMQMVEGIDAQIVRVFDNLKAVAAAAGGSLNRRGQAEHLPHRPGQLRQGQ
jgi:hypothetical protein